MEKKWWLTNGCRTRANPAIQREPTNVRNINTSRCSVLFSVPCNQVGNEIVDVHSNQIRGMHQSSVISHTTFTWEKSICGYIRRARRLQLLKLRSCVCVQSNVIIIVFSIMRWSPTKTWEAWKWSRPIETHNAKLKIISRTRRLVNGNAVSVSTNKYTFLCTYPPTHHLFHATDDTQNRNINKSMSSSSSGKSVRQRLKWRAVMRHTKYYISFALRKWHS